MKNQQKHSGYTKKTALPAATCVILIVCLIFNPVEPHRAEINNMKESMKAIDE